MFLKNMLIMSEIHWNDAVQKEKEQKKQEALDKIEYDKNVRLACEEVWDAMSTEHFRTSDVTDIAMQYGIDEEDLIFSLI